MKKQLKELSTEQSLRYSRHVMLPEMDFEGQEALLNATVLVVGMGGLGCAVAPYLVAGGVGHVMLADGDTIDRTNLQRQILYREQDIGQNKASVAATHLKQLNSEIQIDVIGSMLDDAALSKLLPEVDLVLDCTDNLNIRNLLNQSCFNHKTPLVSGAAIRFEGQVAVYPMDGKTPCYHCFSQMFGEQQLTCMEAGILAPVVGVVGSTQATEALKWLAGIGREHAPGKVSIYDAITGNWQQFKLRQNPDCPVCGK